MDCRDVRRCLTGGEEAARAAELARHLERCGTCRNFAERARAARLRLGEPRGTFEPDAGFAGRVLDRLPRDPAETLGWAAARLLPATLALVLVLAWFAVRTTPDFSALETSANDEDLLLWVLESNGDG